MITLHMIIMSKGVDFVLARIIITFANEHTEPTGDVIIMSKGVDFVLARIIV